jgi:hypothetical protein
MSKEEKLPPRALMNSELYFSVKPVPKAPMVKDLKVTDFTFDGIKYTYWTPKAHPYLAAFIESQNLGVDEKVLIGRGKPAPEVGQVIGKEANTVTQVILSGPYPRSRTTFLVFVKAPASTKTE